MASSVCDQQCDPGALFVTHREPLHIGRSWCVVVRTQSGIWFTFVLPIRYQMIRALPLFLQLVQLRLSNGSLLSSHLHFYHTVLIAHFYLEQLSSQHSLSWQFQPFPNIRILEPCHWPGVFIQDLLRFNYHWFFSHWSDDLPQCQLNCPFSQCPISVPGCA